MSGRKIRGFIKCVILGLVVGVLCEITRRASFPVIWEFLKDYRGTLSGAGGGHGFYWLLPQICLPGLVLAAPMAFSLEGLFATPLEGKRRYWVVFIAPLVYAGLAIAMLSIYILVTESGRSIMSGGWDWKFFIYMLRLLLLR